MSKNPFKLRFCFCSTLMEKLQRLYPPKTCSFLSRSSWDCVIGLNLNWRAKLVGMVVSFCVCNTFSQQPEKRKLTYQCGITSRHVRYHIRYDHIRLSSIMVASSNGNIFRVTGLLCGEVKRAAGDFRRHPTHYDVIVLRWILATYAVLVVRYNARSNDIIDFLQGK